MLVQRVKAEAKTASGLFLPESSVKELNEAKVLAVGPGGLDKDGKRMPMGVNKGDRVLIPQYGGSPVKVGEEEYHLFRDSEYVITSGRLTRRKGQAMLTCAGNRILAKINE